MRARVGALLAGFLALWLPGVVNAYPCDEYYSDYEIVAGVAGVYSEHGYQVPSNAIQIRTMDDGTRVLTIEASAGRNDLEEVLLLGFLSGGLAAACGKKPVDVVVVMVQVTFKDNEVYMFMAKGEDCVKLLSDQVSWDYFLDHYVKVL